MKKRILALILCLLLALTTACNSANTGGGIETTGGSDAAETTGGADPNQPTDPSGTTGGIKMTEKDLKSTIAYIEQLKKDGKLSYAAFAVGNKSGEFFHWTLDGTNDSTLFDMASVTKPVVVTTLFLMAQSEGLLHWDDTLGKYFPNAPADKADIPLWRLLSHSSGLKAGIDQNTIFPKYENEADRHAAIVEYLLSTKLSYTTGTKVLYACNGYVILAEILEKTYGKNLDQLFLEKIAEPLGMKNSGYKLYETTTDIAKHQTDRNRVNDYIAHFLNDVSGNAGLFSNIVDMSIYATALANDLQVLQISPVVFRASLKNRTEGLGDSRGAGWNLVDENYVQAGRLFPNGSFGHTGHTGTSIFVDPQTGLWVVLLTNARNHVANEKVYEIREDFHNTLADDLLKYFLTNAK